MRKCLIGLIFCFIPIFSWAAKIALPTALAHTYYSFEDRGPFYNIDIYVKWEVQPTTYTGTYAGFQFYFQNGGGGYFGTQIDAYGKKAIFSAPESMFKWNEVVDNTSSGKLKNKICKKK